MPANYRSVLNNATKKKKEERIDLKWKKNLEGERKKKKYSYLCHIVKKYVYVYVRIKFSSVRAYVIHEEANQERESEKEKEM